MGYIFIWSANGRFHHNDSAPGAKKIGNASSDLDHDPHRLANATHSSGLYHDSTMSSLLHLLLRVNRELEESTTPGHTLSVDDEDGMWVT